MDIYLPKDKQNKGLAHLVQQDKMHGSLQTTKPNSKHFQSFKHRYLLVEEISGRFKPIYTKEYLPEEGREYPRYPKLHIKTKVPFQLASTSDDDDDDDNDADNEDQHQLDDVNDEIEDIEGEIKEIELQESNAHQSQDRKVYSTASGLISGSVTTLVRPGLHSTQVQKLEEKSFHPKQSMAIQTLSIKGTKVPNKQTTLKSKNISAFFSKSGYCENCIVKYDDFYTVSHIHCPRS